MIARSPLRILLLEDNAADAQLAQDILEADGLPCDVVRVQTRAEFVSALEDRRLDLILADHSLPSFDGISALKITIGARPDLPFIFVSGTLGEEVAIEALKIGATDYVLKTKLSRLVPAVAACDARSRGKSRTQESRTGPATQRSLSVGGAAFEPDRQFRLGRGERTNLLVRRDVSDL